MASTSGERMKKMREKKVKRALKALEVELKDSIDGWLNSPSPKGNEMCGSSDQNPNGLEEGRGESSGAEDNVVISVFYI